jgi:superfamily II helicase
MNIHGWCRTCHKIRRVRVLSWTGSLATVAEGICDECEDAELHAHLDKRASRLLDSTQHQPKETP